MYLYQQRTSVHEEIVSIGIVETLKLYLTWVDVRLLCVHVDNKHCFSVRLMNVYMYIYELRIPFLSRASKIVRCLVILVNMYRSNTSCDYQTYVYV